MALYLINYLHIKQEKLGSLKEIHNNIDSGCQVKESSSFKFISLVESENKQTNVIDQVQIFVKYVS